MWIQWTAIWAGIEFECSPRNIDCSTMLDKAVINSWILYKKVSVKTGIDPRNIMKLADFRTELAKTLCKYGNGPENKRGRPSLQRNENQKRPKLGA